MGKRFVRTPAYCEKQRVAATIREAKRKAERQIRLALSPPAQAAPVPAVSDDFLDAIAPTPATTFQQPQVPASTLTGPTPQLPTLPSTDLLGQLASVEKTDLETVSAKLGAAPGDVELYLRDHLKISWRDYHASMVKQAWLSIRSQLLKQAQTGDIRSITQLVEELADREDKIVCPTTGPCSRCPQCNHIANLSTDEITRLAGFMRGPHTLEDRLKLAPGTTGAYAATAHISIKNMPADSRLTQKEQAQSSDSSHERGAVSSPGTTGEGDVAAGDVAEGGGTLASPVIKEGPLFSTDANLPAPRLTPPQKPTTARPVGTPFNITQSGVILQQ